MARSLDRPPNLLPRRHVVTTLLVLMLLIASGVLFRLSNADLGIWDAGDNPAPTRLTLQVPRGSDDNQQPAASLPAPAPTPTMPPAVALRSPAALPAQIAAKVEIVWPHDNLPVREASLANVT